MHNNANICWLLHSAQQDATCSTKPNFKKPTWQPHVKVCLQSCSISTSKHLSLTNPFQIANSHKSTHINKQHNRCTIIQICWLLQSAEQNAACSTEPNFKEPIWQPHVKVCLQSCEYCVCVCVCVCV